LENLKGEEEIVPDEKWEYESAFSPKLGQSAYAFIGLLMQCVEFPRSQAVKNFTLVSMS
jgi:hypothetical protein